MSFGTISDWKLQAWLLANAEELLTFKGGTSIRSTPGSNSVIAKYPHPVQRCLPGKHLPSGYYNQSDIGAQRGMHYIKKLYRPDFNPPSANYQTPANTLDAANSIDFVSSIPDVVRKDLTVNEELYKTYVYEKDGIQYEADLKLLTTPTTQEEWQEQGIDPGVQIENIEINRLGGNPEEIDSNIKVDIKLYATRMEKLFDKIPYQEKNLVMPSGHVFPRDTDPVTQDQIEQGCSWVDLIKFNVGEGGGFSDGHAALLQAVGIEPAGTYGSDLPNARGYGNQKQRIKLVVGYDTDCIDILKNAGKLNSLYKTVRKPNTDPAAGEFFTSVDDYADYLKQQVEAQTEVYYLNLIQHSISFNASDGSIVIQVNYTASSGTNQIDRKADLLFDPRYYEIELQLNDAICKCQQDLKDRGNSSRTIEVIADPFWDSNIAGEKGKKLTAATDEEKEELLKKLQIVKQKLFAMQSGKLVNGLYGSAIFAGSWPTSLTNITDNPDDMTSGRPLSSLRSSLTNDIAFSRAYYAIVDKEHVKAPAPLPPKPGYWTVRNVGWDANYGTEGAKNLVEGMIELNHPAKAPATDDEYEDILRTDGDNEIFGDVDDTRIEFCFFGDILEVAFEILSSNNRLAQRDFGNPIDYWQEDSLTEWRRKSAPTKYLWEEDANIETFVQPFYWERSLMEPVYGDTGKLRQGGEDKLRTDLGLNSTQGKSLYGFLGRFSDFKRGTNATGGVTMDHARTREEMLYRQFGEVLMSDITYIKPGDINTEITISLADLPISMIEFKKWFRNNVAGGKGKRKHLFLKKYIEMLVQFARDTVSKAIRQENTTTSDVEPPALVINRYFCQPLASGRIIPPLFLQLYYKNGESRPDRNSVSGINYYINRVNMDKLRKSRQPLGGGLRDRDDLQASCLTIIGQTETVTAAPGKNGNEDEDKKLGIPHIHFGAPKKGVLVDINFEREDMPGLREARLFEGKDLYGLDILREKYNSDLRCVGTSFFKPGMMIYIDPDDLEMGQTNDVSSPARALGLGGYHLIVRVNHTISRAGKRSWRTQVETQWQSFGDGSGNAKGANSGRCETSMIKRYALAYVSGEADDRVLGAVYGVGSDASDLERRLAIVTRRRLEQLQERDIRNLHAKLDPSEWKEVSDALNAVYTRGADPELDEAWFDVLDELDEQEP